MGSTTSLIDQLTKLDLSNEYIYQKKMKWKAKTKKGCFVTLKEESQDPSDVKIPQVIASIHRV
jgi:hypothetical protein